jgi:hypothetical protein
MYQKDIDRNIYNLKEAKKDLRLVRDDEEVQEEHAELLYHCGISYRNLNKGIEYLKALEPEIPPEPDFTYTKYPLFGEGAVNFVSGMNPWDSHVISIPFHSNFTRAQWVEGCELLSQYGVNFVRFFMATGEGKDDINNFIYPFKKIGNNKVDLFDYDHDDMVEYEWRLNELWKRGITTMLCLCTGIKNKRFPYCVWHGDRNNGYPERQSDGSIVRKKLATDADYFMRDKYSRLSARKVGINLYKRWKAYPVVIEGINEPMLFGAGEIYDWTRYLQRGLKSNGCPGTKMAFAWFDSGKVEDLLNEFDCRTFPHGINAMDWFRRFHKPGTEMQKHYFVPFYGVGVDADGHISNDGSMPNYDFVGRGLIGWTWNKNFIRACPTHMRDGLVYTYDHSGGGWIIWSAGAWYNKNDTGKPNYNDWYHTAIEGLSEAECRAWNVEWNDFSYIPQGETQRIPLGELVAVKLAMERIFGY